MRHRYAGTKQKVWAASRPYLEDGLENLEPKFHPELAIPVTALEGS